MASDPIVINPIRPLELNIVVIGLTPVITHRWSAKAKKMIELKKMGKASEAKTLSREPTDPEAEFEEATYRLSDGSYAVPVTALKCAMVNLAHKDRGAAKTDVRKAIFFHADEHTEDGPMVRLHCEERLMRRDMVRVGMGSADLRYRPEFRNWHVELKMIVDPAILTPQSAVNLLDAAGFSVGIGEWRPEKDGGGEFGRFTVKAEGKV